MSRPNHQDFPAGYDIGVEDASADSLEYKKWLSERTIHFQTTMCSVRAKQVCAKVRMSPQNETSSENRGFQLYEFSIPFGYFVRLSLQTISKGLRTPHRSDIESLLLFREQKWHPRGAHFYIRGKGGIRTLEGRKPLLS